jgi:hypothetical protein
MGTRKAKTTIVLRFFDGRTSTIQSQPYLTVLHHAAHAASISTRSNSSLLGPARTRAWLSIALQLSAIACTLKHGAWPRNTINQQLAAVPQASVRSG